MTNQTYYVAANDILNQVAYPNLTTALKAAKLCRREGAESIFLGMVKGECHVQELITWRRWKGKEEMTNPSSPSFRLGPTISIGGMLRMTTRLINGYVRLYRYEHCLDFICALLKKERATIRKAKPELPASVGVEIV